MNSYENLEKAAEEFAREYVRQLIGTLSLEMKLRIMPPQIMSASEAAVGRNRCSRYRWPLPRRSDGPARELRSDAFAANRFDGQGELFGDDCSQFDALDREPVFWSDGADQSTSDDDFVQAAAAESI